MRPLALLGLVVSILLGAITVGVTNQNVNSGRTEQERSLQTAIGTELAVISSGEHQTAAALSLMLVNPAVRSVLSDRPVSPRARASNLTNAALALGAVKGTALLPLSAACLDGGTGRQLVCAPMAAHVTFPAELGRQFAALASTSAVGAASGAFLSPVTDRLSVAFLAPFIAHGHLLGLVHLDVSIADTRGSELIVNQTPGVVVSLGSYDDGRLLLDTTSSHVTAGGIVSPASIPLGAFKVSAQPRYTSNGGHRAIVAGLPLKIGGARQTLAVAATALAANPDFFNTLSAWGVALLLLALVMLAASSGSLLISHRRVARELSTDPLTNLRNRRALMADLPRACTLASDSTPAYLWFFDLNGFKRYNDSFGHLAGDRLLTRLGARLREVVRPYGFAYRLGGDEFCVIVNAPVADPLALFSDARAALTESGGAFTIDASGGAVEIPREAIDAPRALRLADQRMYREKAGTQSGAAELITAVLHAALAQRHPDLDEHSNDVAGDVELLAKSIGLDDDTIRTIVKAGDLHDVGKLGIPDEIITKPGPLNPTEWDFMKQHTVMGEQIIAAAGPSLEPIGPLVRASHERWDGMGYPDGLKEESIPLGARIITICDSFRAMLDERPYKASMSVQEALEELRRCAGTQFDPRLVEIFCRLVDARTSLDPGRAGVASALAPARPGDRRRPVGI